ncbi:MAG: radical SAM protein [Bacillota bacterium]
MMNEKDTICFSINITERCNCRCSYCHFYSRFSPNKYFCDIDDNIFNTYLLLIKYFIDNYTQNIHVRFSGGEPLVIGDRIFDLSKKVYKILGIEPYVLSNGLLLDTEVMSKAKNSSVNKFVVSLENPYDIDPYSVDTNKNIEKIKFLSNDKVSVVPGLVIIKNNMFKKMLDICDYFYYHLNEIPTLSELSYDKYEPPNASEFLDLYENTKAIVKKYFNKTALELFPYVVPELSFSFKNCYVIELYARNRFNLSINNIPNVADTIVNLIHRCYMNRFCDNTECDWFDYCQNIRLFWKNKLNDYCKYKKTICSAYYDSLS